MTKKEIKAAVRKGANLLRRHDDEWFKKLDFLTLNLKSSENCIFAQVFGGETGFCWAVENLFTPDTVPESDPSLTCEERWTYYWCFCMCDYGFEPFDREDVCAYVEEWMSFVAYLTKEKPPAPTTGTGG